MHILEIENQPIAVMGYYRVRKGNMGRERVEWPFYVVYVDHLPKGCSALVATSDMQGIETLRRGEKWGKAGSRFVGHAVAEYTAELLENRGVDPAKAVMLLAGDLHSDPLLLRRGGHGDVREVWYAFRDRFQCVIGVAGNHDEFGDDHDLKRFRQEPRMHLLHGAIVNYGGMRIGGVSGVMGMSTTKPWREPPDTFREMVQNVLGSKPEVLLLHQGPSVRERGLEGQDVIRDYIEACPPALVICGHRNWLGNRVEALGNGGRALNVEGKTVLFLKK